jgi:hypothetical protein
MFGSAAQRDLIEAKTLATASLPACDQAKSLTMIASAKVPGGEPSHFGDIRVF